MSKIYEFVTWADIDGERGEVLVRYEIDGYKPIIEGVYVDWGIGFKDFQEELGDQMHRIYGEVMLDATEQVAKNMGQLK